LDRNAAREQLSRIRSGASQQRGFLRDRAAAERSHVPGHQVGVTEHDAHALHRHVHLVRDDLRERGADPLSELDLPRERDDHPVGLDADALLDSLGRARTPAAHEAAPAARFTASIART